MMICVCMFLFTSLSVAQVHLDKAAQQIAESEMAFSRLSVEKGIRTSFLAFLSDSCVMFNPLPVNGMELYRNGPERKNVLSWKPTRVEIAAGGDYGFSTGPWEIRAAKNDTPAAYGHFFSIWKKEKSGDWKVALDLGISYPREKKEEEALQIRTSPHTNNATKTNSNTALHEIEKSFSGTVAVRSLTDAYEHYASEKIRIYRDGHFPAEGKMKGKNLATQDAKNYSFTPLAANVASSGDLGYTYGVTVTPEQDSSLFVRVWRKENEWKIAVDILKRFKE